MARSPGWHGADRGLIRRAARLVDPEKAAREALAGAPNLASASSALAEEIRASSSHAVPPALRDFALRSRQQPGGTEAWESMSSLRAALGDEGAADLIDLLSSAREALARGAAVEPDVDADEILHRAGEWAGLAEPGRRRGETVRLSRAES